MPSLWQWPVAQPDDLDRWAVYHHFARVLDLDHQANHKPWSWALVEDEPGSWALRLGLLDDARLPRLLRAAAPPLAARFEDAGANPAPVQLAAVGWPSLRAGARASSWTMTFASPATFRNGNRRLPWPSPKAVFGSLRTRWRTFAPPDAGPIELDLALDPIVVTAVAGASRTERIELDSPHRRTTARRRPPLIVGGFAGTITYELVGDADPAAVSALVRLARFAGVGADTVRGFGGVTLGR